MADNPLLIEQIAPLTHPGAELPLLRPAPSALPPLVPRSAVLGGTLPPGTPPAPGAVPLGQFARGNAVAGSDPRVSPGQPAPTFQSDAHRYAYSVKDDVPFQVQERADAAPIEPTDLDRTKGSANAYLLSLLQAGGGSGARVPQRQGPTDLMRARAIAGQVAGIGVLGEQQQILDEQAKRRGELMVAEAGQIRDGIEAMKNARAGKKGQLDAAAGQRVEAFRQWMDQRIDPARIFRGRDGTWTSILAGLSLGIAGATDNKKVIDQWNRVIDQDIAAQESLMQQNKQAFDALDTEYAQLRRELGDPEQAQLLYSQQALLAVAKELDGRTLIEGGDPMGKNKAELLKTGLLGEAGAISNQLDEKQQDVDYANDVARYRAAAAAAAAKQKARKDMALRLAMGLPPGRELVNPKDEVKWRGERAALVAHSRNIERLAQLGEARRQAVMRGDLAEAEKLTAQLKAASSAAVNSSSAVSGHKAGGSGFSNQDAERVVGPLESISSLRSLLPGMEDRIARMRAEQDMLVSEAQRRVDDTYTRPTLQGLIMQQQAGEAPSPESLGGRRLE